MTTAHFPNLHLLRTCFGVAALSGMPGCGVPMTQQRDEKPTPIFIPPSSSLKDLEKGWKEENSTMPSKPRHCGSFLEKFAKRSNVNIVVQGRSSFVIGEWPTISVDLKNPQKLEYVTYVIKAFDPMTGELLSELNSINKSKSWTLERGIEIRIQFESPPIIDTEGVIGRAFQREVCYTVTLQGADGHGLWAGWFEILPPPPRAPGLKWRTKVP